MYGDNKNKDLLNAIKNIISEQKSNLSESKGIQTIEKSILPKLEESGKLIRRIKDFSDSKDESVQKFMSLMAGVLMDIDVIVKNKEVSPKSIEMLKNAHEGISDATQTIQKIWNGTSRTSGNFVANSFKKLVPMVTSQMNLVIRGEN
jgi:hypothetical protein